MTSWRRGPPVTYFGPALDPPLGGSGRQTTTLVRDHEYFIPTKFHQNPSSGSGEEVENVESLRTDDGRTDRRTDDGRCAMTIAHSSLRLRWAKKIILSKARIMKWEKFFLFIHWFSTWKCPRKWPRILQYLSQKNVICPRKYTRKSQNCLRKIWHVWTTLTWCHNVYNGADWLTRNCVLVFSTITPFSGW